MRRILTLTRMSISLKMPSLSAACTNHAKYQNALDSNGTKFDSSNNNNNSSVLMDRKKKKKKKKKNAVNTDTKNYTSTAFWLMMS